MKAASKVSIEINQEQLDKLLKSNPSLMQDIKIKRKKKGAGRYSDLKSCESVDNGRRISFNFSIGGNCVYDMVSHKFQHIENGVYSDFNFHELSDLFSDRGRGLTLSEHLASKSEGWVAKFFNIFEAYLAHRYWKLGSAAKQSLGRKALIFDPNYEVNFSGVVGKIEVLPDIEKIAKDSRLEKWNVIEIIDCLRNLKWDFGKFNSAWDSWFVEHSFECFSADWYVDEDDDDGDCNYDDDDYEIGDGTHKLMTCINGYIESKNHNKSHEVLKYAWEKYRVWLFENKAHNNDYLKLLDLVESYGYDFKRLIDYVFSDLQLQGIIVNHYNIGDILTLLDDYVRMNEDMGCTRYSKYPKSLKMAHDIILKNYKVRNSVALAESYKKLVSGFKKYEYSSGDYVVVSPKSLQSIVLEGASLSHCVSSYIKNVVGGSTMIMFLRHKDKVGDSLVTLEVKDYKVVQAKGLMNRSPTDTESDFINLYSKFLGSLKGVKPKKKKVVK